MVFCLRTRSVVKVRPSIFCLMSSLNLWYSNSYDLTSLPPLNAKKMRVPHSKRFFTRNFKNFEKAWEYYSMLISRRIVSSYSLEDNLFDSSQRSLCCYDFNGRQVCELIFNV